MVFDSIPGVALTETPPKDVGTTKAVGTGTTSARWDHVHDTAAGFIDSSDKFAAGVVNTTALKNAAITTAKIANGAVTKGKLAFKTWEKLAEITLTEARTSITVTGLDLDASKALRIIFTVNNPTASACSYYIYFNGDTTTADYWMQHIHASGTSISANRQNLTILCYAVAGDETSFVGEVIRAVHANGRPKCIGQECRGNRGGITFLFKQIGWVTISNVTQIDIVASVSGGIGADSKLILLGVTG